MSKPLVLELSISDAIDENKTLSENLAHRESTNTHQYDPDASIHDQDDNALDSDSDDQVTVEKKGRGKEKDYDIIETLPDFKTANEKMKTYDSYRYRYLKKSVKHGDRSYYACSGHQKCPKMMYLLKVINIFNFITS